MYPKLFTQGDSSRISKNETTRKTIKDQFLEPKLFDIRASKSSKFNASQINQSKQWLHKVPSDVMTATKKMLHR